MESREFRRELHRHPELSFEEHRTQQFILSALRAEGIEVREIARTGVLAKIEGRRGGHKRAVVLRADIDALPINELNDVEYRSENEGVMHACGHDMHAAMLFGVLLASVIRYLCHVISGATIWAGLSIPSEAALIYSLSYNATYMVPETIILALVTVYITSAIDFTRDIPTRIPTRALDKAEAYGYLGAGFSLLVGLIVATVLVFRELQDPDSGEFVITNIKNVNGVALLTVALVTLALCAACVVFARLRRARAQK